MDGGRDFEAEAARLGPQGRALLQHVAAELRRPPSPYLWPDDTALEVERAELERAVAAGFKVHLSAVLVTTIKVEGKQAACKMIPPVRRGKAQKKDPARVMRARLIVDLWRRFQRPGLCVLDAHAKLEELFNSYRKNVFPFQRNRQASPPRGDYRFDDLFWRILKMKDAPMVTYKTILKYKDEFEDVP